MSDREQLMLAEIERLRDLLEEQYAKTNAVWELMQKTPFSVPVAQVDLVAALTTELVRQRGHKGMGLTVGADVTSRTVSRTREGTR